MMMNEKAMLKQGERLDDLQISQCKIIQNPEKFCFGIDAVLLSEFVKVKKAEKVLDLGTGTGIIPILLDAKKKGQHFTALEIQEESVDMARRSVRFNEQEDRIQIVQGDIKEAGALFGAASFEVVTTNPPYMTNQHGLQNPNPFKAIARHELMCSLEDVIREGAKVLVPNGRFYMVHRPFRLAEIVCLMTKYKIEPKRMRFVYPYVNKEPNLVLIEGLKGGRARLTVEEPLIVYQEPNVYTEEIKTIYSF
ncbi:MAG: tRNA1Val (adenine37-N6)-methyltransferase [Clostridiales bacterium]|nr:tRNA1Val (adenine37-N6)-methyltransferase [Clostridiales bacterium]